MRDITQFFYLREDLFNLCIAEKAFLMLLYQAYISISFLLCGVQKIYIPAASEIFSGQDSNEAGSQNKANPC